MATLVTGRTIGPDALPIGGTGFEYDSEGRLAELLAQRVSPLYSHPITGEWVIGLTLARATGGAYERGMGVFPPGNAGPPEHIHPTYDEHFDVVQGEFVFKIAGKEQPARAGDKLLVSRGTPHTFRCVGQGVGAVIAETRPAARTGEVIATLFGMAHEGKLTSAGQPRAMHALVIASEYADDTVFTSPPPAITIPIAKIMAPLARALGYRSNDPRYLQEEFWRAHVEQP